MLAPLNDSVHIPAFANITSEKVGKRGLAYPQERGYAIRSGGAGCAARSIYVSNRGCGSDLASYRVKSVVGHGLRAGGCTGEHDDRGGSVVSQLCIVSVVARNNAAIGSVCSICDRTVRYGLRCRGARRCSAQLLSAAELHGGTVGRHTGDRAREKKWHRCQRRLGKMCFTPSGSLP